MSLTGRLATACLALAAMLGPVRAGAGVAPAFLPDFLRVQFAGSQGLISAGAGKSFLKGLIEPELDYGYIPEWAGGRDIHILTQRTTIAPFPIEIGRAGKLHPVIFGYSLHIALGDRYFLFSSKYADYYWPSALHLRPFIGSKLGQEITSIQGITSVTGILEVGAIDSYLRDSFANRSIGLGEVLSAAIAVQLSLGRREGTRTPAPIPL